MGASAPFFFDQFLKAEYMQDKNKALLTAFYKLISEAKIDRYEKIAADRTRYLTLVVENIYQDHNASAVIRSCDCFGIQDIHIIEKSNEFNVNREIAMGAGQWITQHKYTNPLYPTNECIKHLKDKGYKVVATSPYAENDIHQLPLDQPIALLFGTEQQGLSESALTLADEHVKIPMFGFTESFNISVSAALCMQVFRKRFEEQNQLNWRLSEEEQTLLKIEWCKNIIKNPEKVERELKYRLNIC